MSRMRLMTTPPQFVLSRLSRQLYMEFLAKARAKGFAFVRYQDFLPGADALPRQYIVLRHDVDFAPQLSLEMAELEHAAGVCSTFFVLVDGQFYNPLEREIILQLRRIHALGHEIGLHFAVSSSVDPDLGQDVAFRLRVLSSLAGAQVRAYSQHDPVNAGAATVALPDGHESCVDATQVVRDHDLLYVSDSGMMWRRHTFDTALDQDRNLCLLAHPHSWLHPQDDYVAMIREFESREVTRTMDRYDEFVEALPGYYARRLGEAI
jgi:hypothetical protein